MDPICYINRNTAEPEIHLEKIFRRMFYNCINVTKKPVRHPKESTFFVMTNTLIYRL